MKLKFRKSLLNPSLSVFCVLGLLAFGATAQDSDIGLETLDEQEQELPALRVQGPITVIRLGALVFTGFDTDRDYIISRAEASAGSQDAFKRADKDGNRRISLFELEDWREAALGSLDALPGNLSFDTDYNNQITATEFETAMMELFNRHDADDDGKLKHAELMTILEVPRHKDPEKQRQTDRECAEQLQRNRSRF